MSRAAVLVLLGVFLAPVVPLRAEETPSEEMSEVERQAALARLDELDERGNALYRSGKYDEVLPLVREMLALREKVLGPEHPDVAESLNNLALVLSALGQHAQARPLCERSLQIYENAFGTKHPEVATSLDYLAKALLAMGRHAEALPRYERALRILEEAHGPDHPKVALGLNSLADALRAMGRYEVALAHAERALRIYEKALPPGHPHLARTQLSIANLLNDAGRYDEAQSRAEGGLATYEKALGPDHPFVAMALNTLANVLTTTGRPEEAQALYERALGIVEKALGPEHPYVAGALHNLAVALKDQGHYEQARPLCERSLRIMEKAVGPEHPDVSTPLNSLAEVLTALGQHEAARLLCERAVRIDEKALGAEHPHVGGSLNNLAGVLWNMGRPDEARPLFERALRIQEKALGTEHARVAVGLNNLANVLRATGQPEQARLLYERALRIQEKALGPDHPEVVRSLLNLAGVLNAEGGSERAGALVERALRVSENALGSEHPTVARCLDGLAQILGTMGRFQQARPLYERCLDIAEGDLRRSLAGLQASERYARAHGLRTYLDRWIRLAHRLGLRAHPELLRFKGLAARATAAERRLARRGGREGANALRDLRAAERRLSKLANTIPPMIQKPKHAAWREAYARAGAEREALALALARDWAPFREGMERLDLTGKDIRAHLGRNAVLVDFLRSDGRYLAWVVPAEGEVVLLDLGESGRIEAAAQAFVASLAGREGPSRGVVPVPDEGNSEEGLGEPLRKLLFAPLEAAWDEKIDTVYLCPDAVLAAVPFAALPGGQKGRFLVDDFVLVNLSMAQDLVPWPDAPEPGEGALAVGDVDYRSALEGAKPPAGSAPPRIAVTDRAPRGHAFLPLPETQDEVRFIRDRVGERCAVLVGGEATEARLRSESKGKRVLHLATHGFVMDDLMRGLGRRRGDELWLGAAAERQLAAGHDPMNLAGLALAGANPRDGGHGDDGILTAAESSYLDLDGVDLVVLSACETALGKAESGEGVIGLVQGFQMAGAQRVIASLWQVDDEATRLLMQHLYDAMLREKDPLTPAEALREAALKVRASTGSGGRSFAAPRYWAGFVCYGR